MHRGGLEIRDDDVCGGVIEVARQHVGDGDDGETGRLGRGRARGCVLDGDRRRRVDAQACCGKQIERGIRLAADDLVTRSRRCEDVRDAEAAQHVFDERPATRAGQTDLAAVRDGPDRLGHAGHRG